LTIYYQLQNAIYHIPTANLSLKTKMTSKLFSFGMQRMMQIAGEECKTILDNEIVYFRGILDQQSELIQDDMGTSRVDNMFRLTVLRDIATRIPKDVLHKVYIDNEEYTVRHILLTGDGENCEIYLTKLNAFKNECSDPEGNC
jgi:hypothetical protein